MSLLRGNVQIGRFMIWPRYLQIALAEKKKLIIGLMFFNHDGVEGEGVTASYDGPAEFI